LIGLLGNENVERLFLNCSESAKEKNLTELKKENRIDFDSTNVSVFSIEALDSLLLNEMVRVDSEDSLLINILKLGFGYRDLLRHIQLKLLSEDGLSLLSESFDIPPESVFEFAVERITHLPPPSFNSQIISGFPEIFAEFRVKHFSVLWRGSRDGFGASEFHRRCDGHANTLTVILDTKGNIFGGFTPVEWESRVFKGDGKNCVKADDSLKSFVFTLKNPHNFPTTRFALKAEEKWRAIYCNSERGSGFGWRGCDIFVSDNCNTNTNSYTAYFGTSYVNNTGLNGRTFFTGSDQFQVKEIEVFEIRNQTTFPHKLCFSEFRNCDFLSAREIEMNNQYGRGSHFDFQQQIHDAKIVIHGK
jgi:hypothetical protein